MIEQKDPQFLPIKKAIYVAASNRFDRCRFDPSKALTDKLIEYVKALEGIQKLSKSQNESV